MLKPDNNKMKQLIHQYDFSQLIKEPTDYSSSLLDLFLVLDLTQRFSEWSNRFFSARPSPIILLSHFLLPTMK